MKFSSSVCALVLAASATTFAQTPPDQPSASDAIAGWVSRLEATLVATAEAMPESKYDFAPTAGEFRGVRNFARQVKHIGAVHYLAAASLLGEPPPADAADERGPDSARTKADVVRYLKDSFAYLRKAASTVDDRTAFSPIRNPFGPGMQTRVGVVVAALAHSSNHYGQMVEYLRMNGIVPPATAAAK